MIAISSCRSILAGAAVFFIMAMTLISAALAADNSVSLEPPESIAVAISVDTEIWTKLYQSVSDLKIIGACMREDHTQVYIET